MILVELYSKEDCHLCEVAKGALKKIRKLYPFELHEIMIQEGDEYFETMKERIPVIHINKEFAFQHRVPEQEFIKKLHSIVPIHNK
ncbi:MAG: glutaredoxin family protein [Ignavibacteriae bacterium]|nr:glutaredoxin family protein [Ignavibacteriota bacterium]